MAVDCAPRALIVGQDRQETPLRHLVMGMRAVSWEVSVINSDEYFLRAGGTIGRLLSRATEPLSWGGVANVIMAKAQALRPDVILGIKSLPIDTARRISLHSQGAKLGIWYPDVSFEHGAAMNTRMLEQIDFFATAKHFHLPYMASYFPGIPTLLVEHGYCDGVHHPVAPRPTIDFDIAYVGNHSPHKHAAILALAAARPNLRIGISGHGWEPDARWQTFAPFVGEEMNRFLSRAKIALAVHYGPHGSQGWEDTTSARTFEIPACGVFMLHPDNAEVRSYFEPEDEIGVFRDHDDLVAQVDRWLADDALRERVAKAGLARARPAYAYSERGRKLGRWLNELGTTK